MKGDAVVVEAEAEVVTVAATAIVDVVEVLARMQSSETGRKLVQSAAEVGEAPRILLGAACRGG
jgi:hypothetical protein